MNSVSPQEVWSAITKDLNDKKNEWWLRIVEKYNHEDRVYHDLNHLESKYILYLSAKHLIKNTQAVEFALFFNYFEYDPKSMDNYEKNVEHFKIFCKDCEIDPDSDLHKDVIDLLLCSGTHITDEHKNKDTFGCDDRHYFLDLDMAILGSDPETYAEYATKVKQEYNFLPSQSYNTLRVKVLQTFLQIPNIFATQAFRNKFESQARINIQKEIESLQ